MQRHDLSLSDRTLEGKKGAVDATHDAEERCRYDQQGPVHTKPPSNQNACRNRTYNQQGASGDMRLLQDEEVNVQIPSFSIHGEVTRNNLTDRPIDEHVQKSRDGHTEGKPTIPF